jgi:CheY-like chemotaxis protein
VALSGAKDQPRILVVDDDEALLRMIRLTLISEGYAVTTATDGFEGLAAMARAEFALVVLDLQMPRMDGRMMYAEMQRRGCEIPVLLVSAYGAEAARKSSVRPGA